jgi:hypothetical protein
MKPPESLHDV